jgi:ribosomal protein L7/L12
MENTESRVWRLETEVARLNRLVEHLYQALEVVPPPEPGFIGFTPDVVAATRAGELINAIKLHRQHTGLGLREAKDAVDSLAAQLR